MQRRHHQFDVSPAVHFVTTTITDWTPVFTDSVIAEHTLELFDHYRQRAAIDCLAFVLMPHHFHVVLWPEEQTKGVSWLMQHFKRSSSVRIQTLLNRQAQHPVWMDNFRKSGMQFHPNRPRVQVWMDRYDDVAVTSQEAVHTKLNYTHYNAVKSRLCERPEDYHFSSASDYMGSPNHWITVRCDLISPVMP